MFRLGSGPVACAAARPGSPLSRVLFGSHGQPVVPCRGLVQQQQLRSSGIDIQSRDWFSASVLWCAVCRMDAMLQVSAGARIARRCSEIPNGTCAGADVACLSCGSTAWPGMLLADSELLGVVGGRVAVLRVHRAGPILRRLPLQACLGKTLSCCCQCVTQIGVFLIRARACFLSALRLPFHAIHPRHPHTACEVGVCHAACDSLEWSSQPLPRQAGAIS